MKLERFNQIWDWNPQLYREIKGKFRWRFVMVAAICSGLFQFLIVWVETSESEGILRVDWQGIFSNLNWWVPMLASAIGAYQLSKNLARERQHGTIHFLRLPPQPSERILLGKLLGVPFLLYVGIALALPLHIVAAMRAIADLSLASILLALAAIYLVWLSLLGIFYNFTLLLVLSQTQKELALLPALSSALAFILTPLALIFISPSLSMFSSVGRESSWNWFFLPESFQYPWMLGTLFVINFWIWNAANRSFHNPNASLISKTQSYWMIGCMQIWLLGFMLLIPIINSLFGQMIWSVYLVASFPLQLLVIDLLRRQR